MAQPVNKFDRLLIFFVVVAAIFAMVFINVFLYKGVATGVEIYFDGKPYASYSFSELPKEKTLEINTNIGYNIIRIVDNTVVVSQSSCKDSQCVKKIISKPNQSIVCLPNKLLIKLVGKTQVDSVSY